MIFDDLALLQGTVVVQTMRTGDWVKLPNGALVSPATNGWEGGPYTIKTILPADALPEGKIETGTEVQVISGNPKRVRLLADRPLPTSDDVNDERDRRILIGTTVTVTGVGPIPVQGRAEDIRNLQGLGQGAIARLLLGDTSTVTVFRDAFNQDHGLYPAQVLELWQLSATHISNLYAVSWAMKDGGIPLNYKDDIHWPA